MPHPRYQENNNRATRNAVHEYEYSERISIVDIEEYTDLLTKAIQACDFWVLDEVNGQYINLEPNITPLLDLPMEILDCVEAWKAVFPLLQRCMGEGEQYKLSYPELLQNLPVPIQLNPEIRYLFFSQESFRFYEYIDVSQHDPDVEIIIQSIRKDKSIMELVKKEFLKYYYYSIESVYTSVAIIFKPNELKQQWIELLQKKSKSILHIQKFEQQTGILVSLEIPQDIITTAIHSYLIEKSGVFSYFEIELFVDLAIIKKQPNIIHEHTEIQQILLTYLLTSSDSWTQLSVITSSMISLDLVTPEIISHIQQNLFSNIPINEHNITNIQKGIEKGIFSSEFLRQIEAIQKIGIKLGLSGKIEYEVIKNLSPEEQNILLSDENTPAYHTLKYRIQSEIPSAYRSSDQRIISDGFDAWTAAGFDIHELWQYLTPNGNRHDELQHIPTFLTHIPHTDEDRKIIITLFRASTLGSGLQKATLRHIMEYTTSTIWQSLKITSMYPNQAPPLSDLGNINLIRIKNEIQLYQNTELIDALEGLPTEKRLRLYALTLSEHPTINIDAITNFVKYPDAFFDSRTGAGESTAEVGNPLSILSPTHAKGDWNATEARDAIVEGTYDRLNVFPSAEATWQEPDLEYQQIEQLLSEVAQKQELTLAYLAESIPHKYKKVTSPHIERARIQFFLEDMRTGCKDIQTCNIICDHIAKKGTIVIEKSLALYAKKHKILKETYTEMLAKAIRIQKASLQTKNPVLFWEHIGSLGFLDSMPLHQHISRISNRHIDSQLPTEESYINHCARHTEAGRQVLKQCIEDMKKALAQKIKQQTIQVEILRPSDPDVATAGSTTGNCDAFGHGKKSHFMINPGTAQLLVRINGRMIAQSTLTLGKSLFDTGTDRVKFFSQLIHNSGKIGESITAESEEEKIRQLQHMLEVSARSRPVITLDSVEVIPNLPKNVTQLKMKEILEKGFSLISATQPLYADAEVRAGTQYSFFNAQDTENTNLPIIPLAYTDDIRPQNTLIRRTDTPYTQPTELPLRKAVPADALSIALMEEIAFRRSNGASYITGYPAITSELWESTVSTEHRRQSPLSFITHDTKGVPTGYLIAYTTREGSIYITDTATTGTEKGTGSRLLLALLESVAKDPSHTTKSIHMDCRGSTSAQAIATKREFIESLEFTDQDGNIVTYTVKGPNLEEISGDQLYHFSFYTPKATYNRN